jgi:hypothetical protein
MPQDLSSGVASAMLLLLLLKQRMLKAISCSRAYMTLCIAQSHIRPTTCNRSSQTLQNMIPIKTPPYQRLQLQQQQ